MRSRDFGKFNNIAEIPTAFYEEGYDNTAQILGADLLNNRTFLTDAAFASERFGIELGINRLGGEALQLMQGFEGGVANKGSLDAHTHWGVSLRHERALSSFGDLQCGNFSGFKSTIISVAGKFSFNLRNMDGRNLRGLHEESAKYNPIYLYRALRFCAPYGLQAVAQILSQHNVELTEAVQFGGRFQETIGTAEVAGILAALGFKAYKDNASELTVNAAAILEKMIRTY